MTENEFKLYLALGLCAPGVWGGQKEPIAYLYNGVRLPKLPEWDKIKYPYAVISQYQNTGGFYLSLDSAPITVSDSGLLTYRSKQYTVVENEWVDSHQLLSTSVVWANHDVYTKNGNSFLAASAPIPIYE